jgi:hypothetical protein
VQGCDSPPIGNCYTEPGGGGWWEWNSCTTSSCCDPPDCDFFNDGNCTKQKSSQGNNTYGYLIYCVPILQGHADEGCSYLNGRNITFTGPYMNVFELDDFPGNPDDFIQTLFYGNLQKTVQNCTIDDCPQQSSTWYSVSSRNPPSPIILDAKIRFTILSCVAVDEQCP